MIAAPGAARAQAEADSPSPREGIAQAAADSPSPREGIAQAAADSPSPRESIAQADADSPSPPEGIAEAVHNGAFHLAFRYRYEFVEQDGIDAAAHASTLRTVIGYRTAPLRGFDLFIAAENVVELGDDWYRDAGAAPRGNAVARRPVVADPAGTDISQIVLRYRGYDTDIRIGRQELNLGDQRFVGAVGWRQHHQTFGAVVASNASLGVATIQYAYINDVYRIFGDKLDTGHHLLHAAVDAGRFATLRLYGIFLDYRDEAFSGLSRDSFGVEVAGARDLRADARLHYEVEYARQRAAGVNPGAVAQHYAHLLGGFGWGQWATTKIGWESLGGSVEDGQFQTPLATLHKFNGFADKFLSTPTDGLRDLYVAIDGRLADVQWLLAFHRFSADSTDARYGRELDWQVAYETAWEQTFAFKGAYYVAEAFATDTLKIWLWTTYTIGGAAHGN